jgi:hypothetical protein
LHLRKVLADEIRLPIIRMYEGRRVAAKGVHINDLAVYIDKQRAAALKECEQLKQRFSLAVDVSGGAAPALAGGCATLVGGHSTEGFSRSRPSRATSELQ